MQFLVIIFEFALDLVRTFIVEELAGRVRGVRFHVRPRGMKAVWRHVHHKTRNNLLNRLSTGKRQ